jgi:hypothetical protein
MFQFQPLVLAQQPFWLDVLQLQLNNMAIKAIQILGKETI